MRPVIITDVKYRMAVPVIRQLKRSGCPTICVEYETTPPRAALGFQSRACDRRITLPYEEGAFLKGLKELALSLPERPVLIPVGRRTLGIVSRHPELSCADFLVPGPQALELADNKYQVQRLARELGVPAPFTTSLSEWSSVEELAGQVPYPCVVKYQNGEALGLKPAQRYTVLRERDALVHRYREMARNQENPIVQEYVEGPGLGVSLLLGRDGGLLDFICHERLREYPASGGPSSLCVSVFDRQLLKEAYRLLRGLGFCGVAMVEFKGGLERPRLMEVNPRFWGTSPLVAAAQSTFYETLYRAAGGEEVPLDLDTCQPNYQVGRKMRFTPQDLLSFPGSFRRSGRKLAFLGGYLRDCCNPKIKDGLFRASDPKPYFRYLANALKDR